MSNESKHANHHANRDQYKRHIDGAITINGQVETHLPPEVERKHDARDEENDGRDKNRFRVEILTLIFVVVGAGLTGWYVWITRHMAETGDVALYRQTRPWLGPVGTASPSKPMTLWQKGVLPESRLYVPYQLDLAGITPQAPQRTFVSYDGIINFRNYGPSPAIHAAYSVAMAIDFNSIHRASDSACNAAEKEISGKPSEKSRGGITVFPNSEQPEAFVAGAVSDVLPDRVFLLGCIKYDDTNGNRHTTRFCQFGLTGDARSAVACGYETFTD